MATLAAMLRRTNFLETCDIIEAVPEAIARRSAQLRRLAKTGSAIDALVVAFAEPGGIALTSDPHDLESLASHAIGVSVLT